MLFRWKYLCLKKKIFISIRFKIANGFLGGKVRSAETCHSRKYHKCYKKKKKMREKNTRMRAADQIENTKIFCYHLKQMLIFLYYTQNNARHSDSNVNISYALYLISIYAFLSNSCMAYVLWHLGFIATPFLLL